MKMKAMVESDELAVLCGLGWIRTIPNKHVSKVKAHNRPASSYKGGGLVK